MNTIKTIVVVATLLGVGYGAHIVLNNPIPNRFSTDDGAWQDLQPSAPQLDFSAMSDARPQVSLPELQPTPLESVRSKVPELVSSDLVGPSTLMAVPPSPSPLMDMPHADAGGTSSLADFRRQTVPTATETATDVVQQAAEVAAPVVQSLQAVTAPPAHIANEFPPDAATLQPSPTALASVNMPTTGYVAEGVIPAGGSLPQASGSFESAWAIAEKSIVQGQYADALLAMSHFYRDERLTVAQRERLVSMMDEVAGSAIYSNAYHLQAPHTAQAGETLEMVASRYGLNAEFLSRVNQLPNGLLTPGTQLKVVQGPFRAELSLSQREITLFLGQYYAGRFSCAVGRDLPAQVDSLEVVRVDGARPYADYRTGEQIPAGDAMNPYGSRWIELRSSSLPGTAGLGIHAYGAAVDASDTRGCISVSSAEADDLAVILSPGSRVTIVP